MSIKQQQRTLPWITIFIVCSIIYLYRDVVTWQIPKHRSNKTKQASPKPQQHESDVVNVIEVHSVGNFTNRVAAFNDFLISQRIKELRERGSGPWKMPTLRRLEVVLGKRDDYLQLLYKYNSVKTVVLPRVNNSFSPDDWTSLEDTSNLLIQTYYWWSADDRACSWITTNITNYKQNQCSSNVSDSVRPSSLRPTLLRRRPFHYWPNGSSSYPTHFYALFYIHVHRDAIVTKFGDVISGNLKLVLSSCGKDFRPQLSFAGDVSRIPIYNELFVITQHWGTAYFHFMVEVMPRLALYAEFLKTNPQIPILAPEAKRRLAMFLKVIGLYKPRLVSGVSRAKIVYQPRTTPCGAANLHESQMLSYIYRNYIKRTFPPEPRNKMILIRRSKNRIFIKQKEIEKVLKRAAADYNLTYALFIDNPSPSLYDTMRMFHSAVIIVAPHGAGLANMLFSQPGTYVVEGFCNLPHANLCFQWLAYILGHQWHGLMSQHPCGRFVHVSPASVYDVVRSFLRLWKQRQSSKVMQQQNKV